MNIQNVELRANFPERFAMEIKRAVGEEEFKRSFENLLWDGDLEVIKRLKEHPPLPLVKALLEWYDSEKMGWLVLEIERLNDVKEVADA